MSNVKASLSFESYRITNLALELNPEKVQKSGRQLVIEFRAHMEFDEATNKASVGLGVCISPDFKDTKAPFRLDLDIEGTFSFEELPPLDEARSFLTRNAVAILFPYVRAAITTITATAGITPLILPPLNIAKMLNEIEERGSSRFEESN